ncbi:AmpG permease [Chondromyces apiculatus DSM 436]|uniref:AmpG permease n=1 Tax=Chondromyces apiculatus DSM 436 TaxID=1192034 RepID=A0A017T2D0_9BACT|nr:AmpG permease [Chondromyces apiculatus DSM 436]
MGAGERAGAGAAAGAGEARGSGQAGDPAGTASGAAGAAPLVGSAAALSWVVSSYFAEGLPYAIVHKFASEFFTAAHASTGIIGLLSLYGLAWNSKFLWSPLLDVHSTSRRWLLATEVLIGLAVMALAWPAGDGALGLVAGGFALVALLAATHDIAVDGFYLQALHKDAQTRLTGVRVGAYRGALLVGGSVLVTLAAVTSWRWAFVAAGALILGIAGLHAAILPHPASARPASRPSYFAALKSFVRQPQIAPVLAFIVLYRAGDAMMFSVSTPFLKWLGLDLAARGLLNMPSIVASIGGSMLGAFAVSRWGLRRALLPITLLQSLAIPLFAVLAWLRPSLPLVGGIVIVEQLAAGVGTAALMVFLMRRCAGEYKASHFAVASALMSLPATAIGSVSGFLAERVGFTVFFGLAFVASLPGVFLARRVPTD